MDIDSINTNSADITQETIDKYKRIDAENVRLQAQIQENDTQTEMLLKAMKDELQETKNQLQEMKIQLQEIKAQADDLLQEKQKELEEAKYTDTFTGLLNKPGIQNCINNTDVFPVSLIFCDIDDLKRINTDYTHVYGDKVILAIAKILKNNLHSGVIKEGFEPKDPDYAGYAGRFGSGDEFIIVLSNANDNIAITVANRIQNEVSKLVFLPKDATFYTSMTYSIFTVHSREEFDERLEKASESLTVAKKSEEKGKIIVNPLNGESYIVDPKKDDSSITDDEKILKSTSR